MNIPTTEKLEQIYGESQKSRQRFLALAERFVHLYHHKNAEFFSAPGRTEIIGNHTDHNGGHVIASSIDMDTIGAAYPNDSKIIRITSEGYDEEIVVDLENLEAVPKDSGTKSLVAGLMEAIQNMGFKTNGFDACLSTNLIRAAGVSSSASFEMLLCSIVNYFFNAKAMTYTDYARAGQYAENVYWHKASGLMDQLACAVGGPILLDFSDKKHPKYQKIDFSFHDIFYQLIIVNTGKGHADLSREYSEIPTEMKEAAAACGKERLCETTLEELLEHIPEIKNDRAVLRAIHFLEENKRVCDAASALQKQDWEKFLQLLNHSGNSSWKLLQNCYTNSNPKDQKITQTLALTELFLRKEGRGICRVHGGGFAGVIMCVLPQNQASDYISFISKYVGKENVYAMKLRSVGAVHLHSGISPFEFTI